MSRVAVVVALGAVAMSLSGGEEVDSGVSRRGLYLSNVDRVGPGPLAAHMSKHPTAAQRTLIVEPDDTVLPVLDLVGSAARSVALKQFTLDEPRIVQALLEAHRRGVGVRVMLNPHRSSGDRANDESLRALEAAGVPIQWTNPAFVVTHEKSLVIDGEIALIATFNFVGKYFTQTRDYGIVTSHPVQVGQVAAGFEADWARSTFTPDERVGLLWSTT